MTTPWTFSDESEATGGAASLTLFAGSSFVTADDSGDIPGEGIHGLYVADTRILSKMLLSVDGHPLEALAVDQPSASGASLVARTPDRSLLVFRQLHVGRGLRLDLCVHNLTHDSRSVVIGLEVGADLADLFSVKQGDVEVVPTEPKVDGSVLRLLAEDGHRGTTVASKDATASASGLSWNITVDGGHEWETCVEVAAIRGGEDVEPRYRCGEPIDEAVPTRQQRDWEAGLPTVRSDVPGLRDAVQRAGHDLGVLRIFDPTHPDDPFIAAGAPWYMTLFGRDSLIAAWMALLVDPGLALTTLHTLARLQGTKFDEATEEQPGRILHEVRRGEGASLSFADGEAYYGTADATPLFVMLVGELLRWGVPFDALRPLVPAVDAALDWVAGPGDHRGDGFVRYQRTTDEGLVNQGWKDSWDAISFADGRLAEPPIALCEVQGYVYAAWRAGADIAAALGDHGLAARRRDRASHVKHAFNERFWMPGPRALALALDGDGRQVDAIASNMGHCLWTGIVDGERAIDVARQLCSPELFSGWGIRTLSTQMARYNPLSYHNGSVWPHDTAIAVSGLRRAGCHEEANRVAAALLAAAECFGGRLPELFAGLTPDDLAKPVPYPAACSPQAWASASPLLLVRALLGLEPDIPSHRVQLDPSLPEGASQLRLERLPVGGQRLTVEVEGDAMAVRGLPRGFSVVRPS